jgi:hypothetical protein
MHHAHLIVEVLAGVALITTRPSSALTAETSSNCIMGERTVFSVSART